MSGSLDTPPSSSASHAPSSQRVVSDTSEVELRLEDGEEEVEGGVLAVKGGATLHSAVEHHQGDDEEQEEEEEE